MYKENVEELAKRNSLIDPFYKEVDSEKLFKELKGEFKEAKDEYKKGDYEELESELGDMYWIFLSLLNKLEDEGKIKKENVYKKICHKMSIRKPFLVKNEEVTMEEAMVIWNNAKKKEGYSSDRLWDKKRNIS